VSWEGRLPAVPWNWQKKVEDMNDLDQALPKKRFGKTNADTDDEISLIDLLVVLLKYRWMIAVVVVLGLAVSASYYVIQMGKNRQTVAVSEGVYEGRMTVVINPRIGGSGMDKFTAWFSSKELPGAALEEAGLNGLTPESFTVTYRNDEVDIVSKFSSVDREQIERFFSALLHNAESLASVYYAQYAADMIDYFESLRDQGKDYSAQDYIGYRWARDFLSGGDTVLRALYPPSILAIPAIPETSGGSNSPRVASLVIFFASLFFAVFLAFVLNALKNIGADGEVMAKIRGALGRGKKD
jgi:hypothetical protein